MRILIAGCGYVGLRLAEKLHGAGHVVFGLRRNPPEVSPFLTWIRGDLTRPQSLFVPENLDVVVLAAGLRRDTDERYQRLFVDGYRDLLRYFKENHRPIKRVVLVSTTGVFAEQDGNWVDESSPVNSESSPGRFYLEAEELIQQSGWKSVVIRLAGIYGPERFRLITEVREGHARRFPPPPHYLNHLHADDAAGAIAHLAVIPDPESLYVASDREPADRNDVLTWIGEQVGISPIPESAPESSRPARRSGNKRCRSDRLLASGYVFVHPTFRSGYKLLIKGG
jgi:nucleoside-diphosphate-sugar epimerase